MTEHLTSFAVLFGIILSETQALFFNFNSFENENKNKIKNLVWGGVLAGIAAGFALFFIRLNDPKGANLMLLAFNRRLIIAIAAIAILALFFVVLDFLLKNKNKILKNFLVFIFAALIFLTLAYLVPPLIQFTQEFVYFGESGVSTNALLRSAGFACGLAVSLLLILSSFKVHQALSEDKNDKNENKKAGFLFLFFSLLIFAVEFGAKAVLALRNLRIIPRNNFEMLIRLWWSQRGKYPDTFIYLQLILALIMLLYVIFTHKKPKGKFANKALLRKEKARLRGFRRWSWSLLIWIFAAVFIIIVLHYYDTRPPAEIQPEPYEINDGIIAINLENVSDGHLHKFLYVTPNKLDVRFLVVKKPTGAAYGVGLDACDICGVAGYYERGGEEVICRRCDVVMNKNTIGFKGGCNPIPFEYEIKNSKIFIDVKELIKYEMRFK